MKKYFSCFVLTIVFAYQVYTQDTTYARKIINTLSSEGFAGRGYVDDGLEKSAEFIESEYSKMSLLSFNDSYRQHLSYGVNTFPGKMELLVNDNELLPGVDFLIDPTSPSCSGKYNVIQIKSVDLLNHKKLSRIIKTGKGKFLVIDDRIKLKLSQEDAKTLTDLMNYIKYNQDVPFAGIVILTNSKLSWGPSPVILSRPVFTVKTDLLTEGIEHVDVNVESNFNSDFESANLIGYVEGESYQDTFLVITAHYDHLGKMGADVYFPGANDNSSGVAMMLNLAKYFAEHPCKYSVVFIALTGEEVGLLGAKYLTENPVFDLEKIKFLVNFDLAGTGNEGIKVVNGSVFQENFELLSKINLENNFLSSVQKRGEACNSDHCMFYKNGVPCFYIYTLGGSKAYHDIHDKSSNLPLTEFQAYTDLMIKFFTAL
jgi:hypothetical protein